MTIDELNEFMYKHGFCNTNNNEDLPKKYVADLVEDALRDGYTKAIDDFAEALKGNVMTITFGARACVIDRIAEQLKEGGLNV